jgi:hypothetical protein
MSQGVFLFQRGEARHWDTTALSPLGSTTRLSSRSAKNFCVKCDMVLGGTTQPQKSEDVLAPNVAFACLAVRKARQKKDSRSG